MGKSGEFFTFDEVLKRLSIDETKLKRLVSEGEIRAFREGDQMKFRRADVENLDLTGARSEEETGVIDLSAGKKGDSETLTDDLIFDEGDDLDLSSAEAGMATAEISSQDTFVDEGAGMRTEQLPADAAEPVASEPTKKERSAPAAKPRTRVVQEEPKDTLWGVIMTVSAVCMFLAFLVILGARDVANPHQYDMSKLQNSDIAKKIAGIFYKD